MGFKSKSKVTSKETTQTRNINPFKVGGLIFESEDDYQLFKDIDRNISQKVKSVVDGDIDIKDVFNNIKKINVKETYYEAREETDGLFLNSTELLTYEHSLIFKFEYEVGRCFFDKINIIEYCD